MEHAPPVGKIRQSGEGLLRQACWDVARQHHFPSREQVSRLVSDLREEARQAHEDDRENQMTTWETGFAKTTEMLAIGAKESIMKIS